MDCRDCGRKLKAVGAICAVCVAGYLGALDYGKGDKSELPRPSPSYVAATGTLSGAITTIVTRDVVNGFGGNLIPYVSMDEMQQADHADRLRRRFIVIKWEPPPKDEDKA